MQKQYEPTPFTTSGNHMPNSKGNQSSSSSKTLNQSGVSNLSTNRIAAKLQSLINSSPMNSTANLLVPQQHQMMVNKENIEN
jgi:hypothetical protein